MGLNETLKYYEDLKELRQNPFYVLVPVMVYLVIQTLGNGLLYAIIFYEKYGNDPQKRTLVNILISQLCTCWIYHNLTSFHFYLYATIWGPLGKTELVDKKTNNLFIKFQIHWLLD